MHRRYMDDTIGQGSCCTRGIELCSNLSRKFSSNRTPACSPRTARPLSNTRRRITSADTGGRVYGRVHDRRRHRQDFCLTIGVMSSCRGAFWDEDFLFDRDLRSAVAKVPRESCLLLFSDVTDGLVMAKDVKLVKRECGPMRDTLVLVDHEVCIE